MVLGQLACAIDILSVKTAFWGVIGDFNANGYGSAFFEELVEFVMKTELFYLIFVI